VDCRDIVYFFTGNDGLIFSKKSIGFELPPYLEEDNLINVERNGSPCKRLVYKNNDSARKKINS